MALDPIAILKGLIPIIRPDGEPRNTQALAQVRRHALECIAEAERREVPRAPTS